MENLPMGYKILSIVSVLVLLTGCSQFGILASAGGLAASQNSYTKLYNAIDFGVVITTKQSLKGHAYDSAKKAWTEVKEGKEYIYDKTWGLTHD